MFFDVLRVCLRGIGESLISCAGNRGPCTVPGPTGCHIMEEKESVRDTCVRRQAGVMEGADRLQGACVVNNACLFFMCSE